MPALLLLLIAQDGLSEVGRAALTDLGDLLAVETQMAQTTDELRAAAQALDATRRTGDAAKVRELEETWRRIDRRGTAERQEYQLKGRRLLALMHAGLKKQPDDLGLLEVRVTITESSSSAEDWTQGLADLGLLRKARPDRADYHVAQAAFLRRMGRFTEAQTSLVEAFEKLPNDARAHAHAGLIAFDLGSSTARMHLDKALAARTLLRPWLAARIVTTLTEIEIRERETKSDDLPRVEIVTAKGTILLELFENEAPNTVANIIELASAKFFDGTKFHRVEKNYVIQGGDPHSRDADPKNDGTGGPGYTIADELGAGYRRHFRGSLSMANNGPNTNGSQFFITHAATESLDGRYTVFGRVLEGMDIVQAIAPDDAMQVRVLRRRTHEYRVRKQ